MFSKAYGYDDYLSGNGIRLSFSGDESLEDGKIFMLALNELLSSISKGINNEQQFNFSSLWRTVNKRS